MKSLFYLGCVAFLTGLAWLAEVPRAQTAGEPDRAAALKLFEALTPEQQKMVVLPVDDKDRHAEIFPTTKRPGLSFAQLTKEQKVLAEKMLRSMTSDYGAQRCLQVAKQTGEGGQYLTFYGQPTANGVFAWRIATHHLTLVYAEFGDAQANEFGPILLGGNPVKTLWDEEDAILVKLYASLSPAETKAIQANGSANSGAAMPDKATKIGDLAEAPRSLARQLLAKRLEVLAADRRKILEKLIEREGGVDNLRIAIWGNASKGRADGGNYHWRIGNQAIVCDWQTAGKEHIHMTLRAKLKS